MTTLPFNSLEFAELWQDWIEYKQEEFNFKYKGEKSMKMALKKLHRLSGGNEKKAILILEESMSNGWKGFFALKDEEIRKPISLAEKMRQDYGLN